MPIIPQPDRAFNNRSETIIPAIYLTLLNIGIPNDVSWGGKTRQPPQLRVGEQNKPQSINPLTGAVHALHWALQNGKQLFPSAHTIDTTGVVT